MKRPYTARDRQRNGNGIYRGEREKCHMTILIKHNVNEFVYEVFSRILPAPPYTQTDIKWKEAKEGAHQPL